MLAEPPTRHSITCRFLVGAALTLSIGGPGALAQGLFTERVASGLTNPLFVTHAPDDTDRLFIVEQGSGGIAHIQILDLITGSLNENPFLDLGGVRTGGEQGLLGMAFHPNYGSNGLFYLNYTDSGGDTRIEEFAVSGDPSLANPSPVRTILTFGQPFVNHNGGWIGFNPKINVNDPQYLYIATGDGGSGNDPQNNAQDITNNFLGKMLRIDVNGDNFTGAEDPTNTKNYAIPPTNPFVDRAGDDEIWAYGLRNPWRDSFDRKTGDLWIGDVGQFAREEIDFQPASSPGGENYGWRCLEGTRLTGLCGQLPSPRSDPVHEYPRSTGRTVTGGYVYRGPITQARELYFFADFHAVGTGNSSIWVLHADPESPSGISVLDLSDELDAGSGRSVRWVASFGEDAYGNLYITDLVDGEVFKITTDLILGDMNSDGFADNADTGEFISALTVRGNEELFSQLEPSAVFAAADTVLDSHVNNLDAPVFVTYVRDSCPNVAAAAPPTIPEPVTLPWIAAIAAMVAGRRHHEVCPLGMDLSDPL